MGVAGGVGTMTVGMTGQQDSEGILRVAAVRDAVEGEQGQDGKDPGGKEVA
jgi:hypothetical protein